MSRAFYNEALQPSGPPACRALADWLDLRPRHLVIHSTRMIPFFDLNPLHQELASSLRDVLTRVLDSGWYVLGPEVEAFERELAAFHSIEHAVGVANGTDAIELALRALDIRPGAEVVTVAHTAVPTVTAIERAGCRPVFADIDRETYTLDPQCLESAITPRTEAIVPVHLYGQPADMPAIMEIAQRHRLAVIEDCAQALGAECHGKLVGTWGHAAALSFYPTKNLGACGDAGAVLTNESAVARKTRQLRSYGQVDRDHFAVRGINSRLDEVQAAILRVKLEHLAAHLGQRHALAAVYDEALSGVTLPVVRESCSHVYCLYVIRHPRRDMIRDRCQSAGIGTLVHYPIPIHRQAAFADLGYSEGSLPETEAAAAEVVSLPLYFGLATKDIRLVSQTVSQCVAGAKA